MFSGCKKNKDTIINLPLSNLPNCFDPQIANNNDLENIINNCFEGLVRINENGQIECGVAQNWKVSNKGLTYTFNLRKNAKWRLPSGLSNILGEDYEKTFNTTVTANDFVFAIKRALDPNTNAPMAYALSSIESVYSDGEHILIINLSKPNVNFLNFLAEPVCMPCNEKFFEATAGRYGLEKNLILSNGPYYINNIDKDVGITLIKNDSYVGNYKAIAKTAKFLLLKPLIDKITDEGAEPTSIIDYPTLLSLEKNGLDVATISKQQTTEITTQIEVIKYKNAIKAFCFNAKSDSLKDKNIRLALAHATDISLLLTNNVNAAEGIVPSCCGLTADISYRAGSNIVKAPNYDLSKANSYFKNAVENSKDKNGKKTNLSVDITLICLKDEETIMKKLIQDWQKTFGVTLSITIKTFDSFEDLNNAVEAGEYDIAYTTISSYEFLSSNFLNSFTTGAGNNIINLSNETYDTLMRNVYDAGSKDELIQTLRTAECFLVDNAYILPTSAEDGYFAKTKRAKDLSVRPSGTVFALYR